MTLVDRTRRRPRSRGLATLEFVMCLPLLVILWLCLVWVGAILRAQAETVIDARNRAWHGRSNVGQRPFEFESDGPVEGSARRQISVTPILDRAAQPASSHVVLAGSWDHRATPLDRQPHWQLYSRLGPEGVEMQIQNALDSIGDIDGKVAADAASEFGGDLLNIENALSMFGLEANLAQIQIHAEADKKKEETRDQIESLKGDVKALADKIAALEAELEAIPGELTGVDRRQSDEVSRLGRPLKPEELRPFEDRREEIRGRQEKIKKELPELREELRRKQLQQQQKDQILRDQDRAGGSP